MKRKKKQKETNENSIKCFVCIPPSRKLAGKAEQYCRRSLSELYLCPQLMSEYG